MKGFLALVLACAIPAILVTAFSYHQDRERVEIKNEFAAINVQLKEAMRTDKSSHSAPLVVPQMPLPAFSLNTYGPRFAVIAANFALIWTVINILYVWIKRAFGVKPEAS